MKRKSNIVESFKPIYKKGKSKILILGTCPGYRSIDRGFYYMDSNNSFWELIDYITKNKNFFSERKKQYINSSNIERKKIKNEIIAKLHKNGIALYDVVESCERYNSSDREIVLDTVKYTNIKEMCKNVKLIVINGVSKNKKTCTYRLFKAKYGKAFDDKIKLVYSSSGNCSKKMSFKKNNWKINISNH